MSCGNIGIEAGFQGALTAVAGMVGGDSLIGDFTGVDSAYKEAVQQQEENNKAWSALLKEDKNELMETVNDFKAAQQNLLQINSELEDVLLNNEIQINSLSIYILFILIVIIIFFLVV